MNVEPVHSWPRYYADLDRVAEVVALMIQQNAASSHPVWAATWARRGYLFDIHPRPARYTVPFGGPPQPCSCGGCVAARIELNRRFDGPTIDTVSLP